MLVSRFSLLAAARTRKFGQSVFAFSLLTIFGKLSIAYRHDGSSNLSLNSTQYSNFLMNVDCKHSSCSYKVPVGKEGRSTLGYQSPDPEIFFPPKDARRPSRTHNNQSGLRCIMKTLFKSSWLS